MSAVAPPRPRESGRAAGSAPASPRPVARNEGLSVAADGLTMVAIIALWVLAQVLFLGGLSESRAQAVLYRELRADLAAATAPTGGTIDPGDPVALLTIPATGQQLVVVEGTASGDLLAGPGHRRDTPLPGQQGVSVVYGRARSYGAPFGSVTGLRPGDRIVAMTQQGKATFVVDGVRRAGDPAPPVLEVGQARLTLVTAEGDGGALSALSVGSVVYVDATMQGKGFVAEPGRPIAVPASEQAMATDRSALPLLALCLAALLGAVGWVSLASRRWPRTLVWVVTTPVALALLWVSTDVVMRLLPNLL